MNREMKNLRIYVLKKQHKAAISRREPPQTVEHQQSFSAKKSATVPKYHILKRQPEGVQQKSGIPVPQQAGPGPVQSKPPPYCNPEINSGKVNDTYKRGLVQNTTLWTPDPQCHNPETQRSGAVEDTDFKRGPVQNRTLWTAPRPNNPQHAKPNHAGKIKSYDGVRASPKQATIPLSGLQVQQHGTSKTEQTMICISELDFQQLSNRNEKCIAKLQSKNEALETQMQVLKDIVRRNQARHDKVEMKRKNTIWDLEFQLLQGQEREAECIAKLQSEIEALETQMQVLKERLTRNKAVHDEAEMERKNTIEDLEFQLLEKKVTEAEALSKVQELEEALQQQKESQNDLDKCVAQMKEESQAALAQIQSELESRQLQGQEREAECIAKLQSENEALETQMQVLKDIVRRNQAGHDKVEMKRKNTIWDLEFQLLQVQEREAECIAKLQSENEALETQMQVLKERLTRNKAVHDEAEMERKNTIEDLEFQLLEKKVTEAEALSKVQQLEEALQQQKESQNDLDKCVAQMKEESQAALAQIQSELESRQLQGQEREAECIAKLQSENEALETQMQVLKDIVRRNQAGHDKVEMKRKNTIWDLEFQLLQVQEREAECIAKLQSENEALETQMQVLKERLTRNKAVHDEAEMERKNTIEDLEFQLLEKKVTEAEALSKVQQLEEALQQQKESQNDLDKCVAQMKEESQAALAQIQSELESRQLQGQEREAECIAKLQSENEALETQMQVLKDIVRRNQADHDKVEMKRKNTIWDLEFQLLQVQEREAECIAKLQSENEALETQMQVLKERLTRNKAVHDEAEMERKNTIEDLEFQLLEKKVTEAEALSKVQQLEEALQQQKESQNDLDKCVAQMKEESQAALAQIQSELESRQLQGQEREAECIAKLQSENEALETQMQVLKDIVRRNQADHDKVEMKRKNTIWDLEFQLLQVQEREAECIAKLQSENEALETQMQVLKERLTRNKAVHDEAEMERKNTIEDLEFQLLEKKVTEAEALSKVQQLEEALQQQKESQNDLDKCVAQMKEESKAALAQIQSELESRQLQWQEREAECIAKFQSENEALKTQMQVLMERLTRNKAVHDEAEMERKNTIKDLEFQLSEKKATETDLLSKVQQLEEALQQQKESQNDLDKYVAHMKEESNELKAAVNQTESELESHQPQWEEEKANLIQSLSDIQHTLGVEEKTQETRLNDVAEIVCILPEQMKKPKKPSVWKRFKRLFKRS